MNYYALQVKTRSEEIYIKRVLMTIDPLSEPSIKLYFLRKKLTIRSKGKTSKEITPLFPGYVFIEAEKLSTELYWLLRTTPGFFRFLPENKEYKPLSGKNLSIVKHFISFGSVADTSKVTYDENDKINVLDGPLKGLEGKIIKVDKRKGRAKIKIDMYEDSFLIDLAFEVIGHPT